MNREALFAVEHYRPQSLFPHLITEWSNLYYACSACNGAKRSFVARGRRAKTDFVPHPCEHSMFDHLRYRGATVVAHSETGTFAIDLLDLNAPTSIEFREFFERTLEQARTKLAESRLLVSEVETAISGSSGARLAQLQQGLRRAKANRQKAEDGLRYILGPYEALPA